MLSLFAARAQVLQGSTSVENRVFGRQGVRRGGPVGQRAVEITRRQPGGMRGREGRDVWEVWVEQREKLNRGMPFASRVWDLGRLEGTKKRYRTTDVTAAQLLFHRRSLVSVRVHIPAYSAQDFSFSLVIDGSGRLSFLVPLFMLSCVHPRHLEQNNRACRLRVHHSASWAILGGSLCVGRSARTWAGA